jgi:hypothetical protein
MPVTTFGFIQPNGGLRYLRIFIEEFDRSHLLTSGNANLPIEIHFLIMGFAGFGADIYAWRGFLQLLEDWDDDETQAGRVHVPPLSERVYIVPCLEPDVVNGSAPWSLTPGTDYTMQPQKYFHGFQRRFRVFRISQKILTNVMEIDKCYRKFKLTSLMRRAIHNADARVRVRQNRPPVQWTVRDAHFDQPQRNDIVLQALYDEYRLRANQLNDQTVPTHGTAHTRNLQRNRN